jgi:putative ABC transport system ATP-binding protein
MGCQHNDVDLNPCPGDMTASAVTLELLQTRKNRTQGGVTFELSIDDFKLYRGEFVAIVGESGCGKSTILDLLAFISRPTKSDRFCYYNDNRVYDIAALWQRNDENTLAQLRRSQIGYILQTGGLLPFLTVRQNIQLAVQFNGQCDQQGRLDALAERIGVASVMAKKPQYLSGGQRQRVAIVRAMAHQPQFILADEPTAAVDQQRARQIVADLNQLARETHTTVVMVTHDRDLIIPYADRCYGFAVEESSPTMTCSHCYQLSTI